MKNATIYWAYTALSSFFFIASFVFLLSSCAHSVPIPREPVAFTTTVGVTVHGSPGSWITKAMADKMDEDLVQILGPRWGGTDVARCLGTGHIVLVDKLPGDAGSHIDWTNGSRAKLKTVLLAKKRKCALEPGAKGPAYLWILAHVVMTCLGTEDTDESGTLWEAVAADRPGSCP